MGKQKSDTRLRAQNGPVCSFELFVLSRDPACCALVIEAAPKALRVSIVTALDEIEQCLDSHALVCGMIVDVDLDAAERKRMFAAVRARWMDVPALALIRSSAPSALASAHEIGSEWIFKSDDPARRAQNMGAFMREALDGQLWRTARLIQQGRWLGLPKLLLETYIALVVLRLPRKVACTRLGISEPGLEKRLTELLSKWAGPRLIDLTLSSHGSVVKEAPAELMHELERLAESELEDERTQHLGA